jgi:hypothetical protein
VDSWVALTNPVPRVQRESCVSQNPGLVRAGISLDARSTNFPWARPSSSTGFVRIPRKAWLYVDDETCNMQSLLDPLAELRNRVANAGLGRLLGLWASRAPLHEGPMARIRLSPAKSPLRTSGRLTVPPGRSRHLSSQTPSMRQLLKMLFSMSVNPSRGGASRGSRTRPTARPRQ